MKLVCAALGIVVVGCDGKVDRAAEPDGAPSQISEADAAGCDAELPDARGAVGQVDANVHDGRTGDQDAGAEGQDGEAAGDACNSDRCTPVTPTCYLDAGTWTCPLGSFPDCQISSIQSGTCTPLDSGTCYFCSQGAGQNCGCVAGNDGGTWICVGAGSAC